MQRRSPDRVAAGLTLVKLPPMPDDGDDVWRGLKATPKTLPSRYFYDDRGSALFEEICTLPEYYLTRTEEALLVRVAGEIAAHCAPCTLAELGSGSARKTRLLIDSLLAAASRLHYIPVDVSGRILRESAESLLADFPGLTVHGIVGTYEQALGELGRERTASGEPLLVAFLGSTIGNFAPVAVDAFLSAVRATLRTGDHLLIGIDLRKEVGVIEAAYNDAAGMTAAFNLNMLEHLNRRFDADFDLECFRHRAFYNTREHQIEMHLESLTGQTVHLRRLGLRIALRHGETIRTEISRKFDVADFGHVLDSRGFSIEQSWTDAKEWFGLILARAS